MPAVSWMRDPQAENVPVDVYMHIASSEAKKDMITEKIVTEQVRYSGQDASMPLQELVLITTAVSLVSNPP